MFSGLVFIFRSEKSEVQDAVFYGLHLRFAGKLLRKSNLLEFYVGRRRLETEFRAREAGVRIQDNVEGKGICPLRQCDGCFGR